MFIPTRKVYLLRCASSSGEREIFQHVKASGNTLFAVVFGLKWKHGAPPSSALEDSGKCEKAKFAFQNHREVTDGASGVGWVR